MTVGGLEAGFEWAVMGAAMGGPLALGGKLITRAQVGGMVKRLAAKGISTEGMTPSQIVRRCWAEELKAAGKVAEGEMLEEMVAKEIHSKVKMATGAKNGVDATPESIKVGTVRMQEHPDYDAKIAEVEEKGYVVIISNKDPFVEVAEIVDIDGNRLRFEKRLNLKENMMYLDLEHELGHISQMEDLASKENGIVANERYVQMLDKNGNTRLVKAANRQGVLSVEQNIVTEYHNRLVEFIRLYENGADKSILLEHAEGVENFGSQQIQKAFGGGRNKNMMTWQRENFNDISSLSDRFREIKEELGLKFGPNFKY